MSKTEILNGPQLTAAEGMLSQAMAEAGAAVSALVGRQVGVTEPFTEQGMLAGIDCSAFEPAVVARVGLGDSAAALVLRRHDMQVLLTLLMGGGPDEAEELEFDEMSMSAAEEFLNQMMTAFAAAVSRAAGQPVAAQVPQVALAENEGEMVRAFGLDGGEMAVSVVYRLTATDALDTGLRLLVPSALVHGWLGAPSPKEIRAQQLADTQPLPVITEEMVQAPAPQAVQPPAPPPQAAAEPAQPAQQAGKVSVRPARFPSFGAQEAPVQALADANMSLLMNVPLDVSVVVGRTRRRVKDILKFGPGSVVELDKQTGAPAEIMVNGQLLAYGDVIVIGDNFGIRITEIVGTKELLDSLNTED